MLKIRDLQVNYGGISAVKGINIDVPEKSIVTLIGANGAGVNFILTSSKSFLSPYLNPILVTVIIVDLRIIFDLTHKSKL
jgi:ABC-type branched-subunit amino acid transport system ATPase component